jgi:hypothetical protein
VKLIRKSNDSAKNLRAKLRDIDRTTKSVLRYAGYCSKAFASENASSVFSNLNFMAGQSIVLQQMILEAQNELTKAASDELLVVMAKQRS